MRGPRGFGERPLLAVPLGEGRGGTDSVFLLSPPGPSCLADVSPSQRSAGGAEVVVTPRVGWVRVAPVWGSSARAKLVRRWGRAGPGRGGPGSAGMLRGMKGKRCGVCPRHLLLTVILLRASVTFNSTERHGFITLLVQCPGSNFGHNKSQYLKMGLNHPSVSFCGEIVMGSVCSACKICANFDCFSHKTQKFIQYLLCFL